MPQHTKEQLLAMSVEELKAIAVELKTPNSYSDVKAQLVYDILDRQAEMTAGTVGTAPKRRRIVAAPHDHVYSATQAGDSERFDSARDERAAKRQIAEKARVEAAAAAEALVGQEEAVVEAPKRKRGRPTKAEVEARKALEQQMAEDEAGITDAQEEKTAETSVEVPEAATATAEESAEPAHPEAEKSKTVTYDPDLPDFILEQMKQQAEAGEKEEAAPSLSSLSEHFRLHNEATASMESTEIAPASKPTSAPRAAKPADGEDFIIVEDVPVVDFNDYSFVESEPFSRPTPAYAPVESQHSVPKFHRFKDDVLVQQQLQARAEGKTFAPQPVPEQKDLIIDAGGVLEIDPQGIGFLRSSDYNYMPSPDDVFVSQYQIRSYALKMGDVVECKVKVPREGEKYFSLVSVDRINGLAPHQVRDRVAFEHLTPLFPDEQFKLSNGSNTPLACRVVDLFSPIGKGQRALIVAQPKTGKTILMKQIANAIAANYPDTYLMMLLIDERPEEVTDMARTVNAEVIASTFDEPAARHVRIAQMVLDKAKRMVECGHDVVIFLDSITRLARAFNTTAPASGKILTGGVDANALQKPKRFFGAARNIEGGGSLTIIATALIDTGSKMDEVIFEEFKGTGNMELQLDRSLANKRIFPAVNLIQSSTRRDDLLLDELTLNRMYVLRNYMGDMNSMEAMNFVKKNLENSLSNEEFLATMNK